MHGMSKTSVRIVKLSRVVQVRATRHLNRGGGLRAARRSPPSLTQLYFFFQTLYSPLFPATSFLLIIFFTHDRWLYLVFFISALF